MTVHILTHELLKAQPNSKELMPIVCGTRVMECEVDTEEEMVYIRLHPKKTRGKGASPFAHPVELDFSLEMLHILTDTDKMVALRQLAMLIKKKLPREVML